MSSLLKEFEKWMKLRTELSESTKMQYLNWVERFGLDDLGTNLIEYSKGVKNATFNAALDAYKKFQIFLEEEYPENELIKEIDNLQRKHQHDQVSHKSYSVDEVKKLLDYVKGWRRQAFVLALYAGLRRNEIYRLNVNDVDVENGWVVIHKGKGDKYRRVALSKKAIDELSRWKKIRDLTQIESDTLGDPWLWSNRGSRPSMTSGKLYGPLSKTLGFKVNWHRCRATYATRLYYASGKDIVLVQQQLGHASIETTQKYITLLDSSRGERIREVGDIY